MHPPDGIHWKHAHRNVVTFDPEVKPNHLDSQNVILWDERVQKYGAYFRKNVRDAGPGGAKIPRTRAVARAESPDLRFFAKADEAPEVLRADPDNVVKPAAAKEGCAVWSRIWPHCPLWMRWRRISLRGGCGRSWISARH